MPWFDKQTPLPLWNARTQDLERHPNNGWSLLGLWQAKVKAGDGGGGGDVVASAQQRFEKAWAGSEVQIESSCPALTRRFEL